MKVINITTALDDGEIAPKAAKFSMLSLANKLPPFKSNVVEGIADLLTKFPLHSIADKSSFGEVDIQTRYWIPCCRHYWRTR
ncbi:hypothetical protein BC940DRAFT_233010 [Gongronella butleri]|nr:hypothetical protein BC940DRAFT_233010 [Gongronella butleri]